MGRAPNLRHTHCPNPCEPTNAGNWVERPSCAYGERAIMANSLCKIAILAAFGQFLSISEVRTLLEGTPDVGREKYVLS